MNESKAMWDLSGSGIAEAQVTALLDRFRDEAIRIHRLGIQRFGKPVFRAAYAPYVIDEPQSLFSLSKTFTAVAVGFAVQEGLLRVTDRVKDLLPELMPETPDPHFDTMNVKHLLTMNTGHRREPNVLWRSHQPEKLFTKTRVAHTPGELFCYNTPATYMLSFIVQKVTGEELEAYLRPRLLEPLGIASQFGFQTSPFGIALGGYGAHATLEAIVRLGQFLLQEGRWDGQQLLDASWVQDMRTPWSDNAAVGGRLDWGAGYGYQVWCCTPEAVYRGDGAYGQFCVICPRQEMVIAVQASTDKLQPILTVLWETLLTDLDTEDGALSDPLAQRVAALEIAPVTWDEAAPVGTEPLQGTYVFDEGPHGIWQITLDASPERVTLHMEIACEGETPTWDLALSEGWVTGDAPVPAPDTWHWNTRATHPFAIRAVKRSEEGVVLEVVWRYTTIYERWSLVQSEATLTLTVDRRGAYDAGRTVYTGQRV